LQKFCKEGSFGIIDVPTVQCTAIVRDERSVCGKRAFPVTQVLDEPKHSIVELLELNENLSTTLELMKETNLIDELNDVTFLAPHNEVSL
jgi:uncharacterized surface protein with fasciclin (FAS1) repeats